MSGKATDIAAPRIYSTLTSDTTPLPLRRPLAPGLQRDSLVKRDTIPARLQPADSTAPLLRNDTFALRLSKDTLDAPIDYEAEDSAVVLAREKKIILYGKTKTTYKDITLTAPKVELDQRTGIVTAFNSRDSLNDKITRARFSQGDNQFESDTIRFNFKTQKGLTTNTYTKQDEMYVHGETIKKVNANTLFVKRGEFTTCNLDEPHFAFRANKMKLVNSKVAITGPVHPEFEGVPVPVYLPFGFYPLSRGRHSGFLPPTFTNSEQFGLGLTGLGYYKVLSNYFDVRLEADIYSYGGWNARVLPTYRKRYRYNGAMSFSLQNTKLNFKGDPDYLKTKSFFVTWNHNVDQRARPGTTFSANVNAGSTRYNQLIPNNAIANFNNQFTSSIAYSKSWAGKPYNLSLNANHFQNSQNRLINVNLPDAAFTVNTLYPFQQKEVVGTPKWYEKLGIGYSGVFRNQFAFYDTAFSIKHLLDTAQAGAQHSLPITLSLPSLGPLLVSPSISYQEVWLMRYTELSWNNNLKKVDTASSRGFYTNRSMSFGVNFNTNLYGTVSFRNSRVLGIRHTVQPGFGFSYVPTFSRKYFDNVQVSQDGRKQEYSHLTGNIFSGYSNRRFGGITFEVNNILEMKQRSKKDTGDAAIKKVRLIDGFGFRSGYNFLEEKFKLQDFNLYLRSTLFDKVNLNFTTNLTPYQADSVGQPISRYYWQDGQFKVGRFTSGSLSLSTQFKSKPRDASKPAQPAVQNRITDPTLLGDQQRLQEYMRRNPAEFVDFNIPWDFSIDFAANFYNQQKPDYSGFETKFSASAGLRSSFSLTPKWNFSTNSNFNFQSKKLEAVSLSINRDMHCWQMSIGVQKGLYSSFNITISPKSSILQDLKVNRTRTFTNF